MNKGTLLATGEYVCFLNAGDRFASTDAVSRMFIPPPHAELVWGDCIVESRKGEGIRQRAGCPEEPSPPDDGVSPEPLRETRGAPCTAI